MELNKALGRAIKKIREARLLTQEDFCEVSSRTYVSSLERGLKSPTAKKIDELAKRLGVHPLTLMLMTYADINEPETTDSLISRCLAEMEEVRSFYDQA